MKIKSILESIFYPLKIWAEQSTGNWNILVGTGFLLLIASMIIVFVYSKKIGNEDERTNKIFLKGSNYMLLALVLCDVIFPKEYMWQIFFLFKYSISFLVTGIFLFLQYKKDFS